MGLSAETVLKPQAEATVLEAGRGVVGAGDDVAGAALVADESEECTGQIWGYQEGLNNC